MFSGAVRKGEIKKNYLVDLVVFLMTYVLQSKIISNFFQKKFALNYTVYHALHDHSFLQLFNYYSTIVEWQFIHPKRYRGFTRHYRDTLKKANTVQKAVQSISKMREKNSTGA